MVSETHATGGTHGTQAEAHHDQEPWKLPLPQFIEHLYEKRFGKPRPDKVLSLEDRARMQDARKAARKEQKRKKRLAQTPEAGSEQAPANEERPASAQQPGSYALSPSGTGGSSRTVSTSTCVASKR